MSVRRNPVSTEPGQLQALTLPRGGQSIRPRSPPRQQTANWKHSTESMSVVERRRRVPDDGIPADNP